MKCLPGGLAAAKRSEPAAIRRSSGELRQAPAPNSARAVPHELAAHVERLGRERVAELLRVGVDDLPALLDGRVGLPRTALKRLRQAQSEGN